MGFRSQPIPTQSLVQTSELGKSFDIRRLTRYPVDDLSLEAMAFFNESVIGTALAKAASVFWISFTLRMPPCFRISDPI